MLNIDRSRNMYVAYEDGYTFVAPAHSFSIIEWVGLRTYHCIEDEQLRKIMEELEIVNV
jgi:hypothetical protein